MNANDPDRSLRGDSPGGDPDDGPARDERHREAPSYDASSGRYSGISSTGLDDVDDLREAKDFAEMIVDTIREGLLVLHLDLSVKAANESFYQTFAVMPEETLGRKVYDLGNGQWDIPELRRLLEDLLPENKVFNDYLVERDFEGIGARVMRLNARQMDEHQLILLAIEDVTERQALEQSLRESREMHRRAIEAAHVGTWRLDLETQDCHISPQMAALMDYGSDEQVVSYATWAASVHPNDRAAMEGALRAAIENEEPFELEFRIRDGENGIRWLHSKGTVEAAEGGRPRCLYGASIDITYLKQLQRREATFVELAGRLHDEREVAAITYAAAEVIGRSLGAARAGYGIVDEAEEAFDVERRWTSGEVESAAGMHRLADDWPGFMGELRRAGMVAVEDVERDPRTAASAASYTARGVHAFLAVAVVEAGRIRAILYVQDAVPRRWTDEEQRFVREVSGRVWAAAERRQAEEALRESEERFRAVAELVPDLLWYGDPRGRAEWFNQRWTEFTGQAREEAEGIGWLKVIHPHDRQRSRVHFREAAAAERPIELEHRMRRRDGAYRWFIVRAEPVRDGHGAVQRYFGTATDIHEERTARELLEARVAERTRKVRELASTLTMAEQEERRRISQILHDDLQQQLFAAQIKLDIVRHAFLAGQDEEVLDLLDALSERLKTAGRLTRNITVDLSPPILKSEELADALDWLKVQMGELHGLEVEVVAAHPFRMSDEDLRVLLFQIVRELLFNVVKHADAQQATVTLRSLDHHVQITVEDEGRGFDVAAAEAREAADGKPTGFGLFSVRERLGLFGGRMQVESARGEGTRVILDVPFELSFRA